MTNEFKLITNKEEIISDASYFKLNKVDPKKILGGKSVKESADIFVKILVGKGSESQVNVVLANSSLAIRTLTGKDIEECYSIAKESLESGKAYNCLKKLIEL